MKVERGRLAALGTTPPPLSCPFGKNETGRPAQAAYPSRSAAEDAPMDDDFVAWPFPTVVRSRIQS